MTATRNVNRSRASKRGNGEGTIYQRGDTGKWCCVARNVAEAAEVPQPRHPKAEGLQRRELATFLKAIRGDRYERLWLTFLATGLRFGEAAALRWDDIDLDARSLTVRHTITRH